MAGALNRGDDYLEISINTFRFAFVTKKGVSHLMGTIPKMELHTAVTLEGRDDDELPEQTLLAVRMRGLDIVKMSKELRD